MSKLNQQEQVNYRGKLFEVVSEPVQIDGHDLVFEKVRRSPGVRLIIEDEQGNIMLPREFRHELSKVDYRLPGGKVFDSLQEFSLFKQQGGDIAQKAKEAAIKEAKEETGFSLVDLEFLSLSKLGATVEWDLYYFSARVERKSQGAQHLELGENIEIVWLKKEEVQKILLESDSFSEDRSVAVVMRFFHKLGGQ